MRALSLSQPWATLVAIGAKRIESRSWSTSWRGPLAIHASKGFPKWAKETCDEEPFATALAGPQPVKGYTHPDELPLGAIVATAEVVACYRTDRIHNGELWISCLSDDELAFGDYSPGRYAWVLADVRALVKPIPCKGALGLWEVPPDVEARITAQTAAVPS